MRSRTNDDRAADGTPEQSVGTRQGAMQAVVDGDTGGVIVRNGTDTMQVVLSDQAIARLTIGWKVLIAAVGFLGVCLAAALFTKSTTPSDGVNAPLFLGIAYVLVAGGAIPYAVKRIRGDAARFGEPLVLDRTARLIRRGDAPVCSFDEVKSIGAIVDKSATEDASSVWLEVAGGGRHVVLPRPVGYGTVYSVKVARAMSTCVGAPLSVEHADFSPD